MPVEDVVTQTFSPANLIAEPAYPLLSETVQVDAELFLGSILSLDTETRIASLVTAENKANLFGVLRDHVLEANTLAVVYISGAFIKDTLKAGEGVTIDELVPLLRPLGIYARPSVRYPSS